MVKSCIGTQKTAQSRY